jgi:hypothetical protein
MPAKSKGHVAFIADHEYRMVDGSLYRADVRQTMVNGARPGELWAAKPAGEFALRVLRLGAGLREK